MPYARRMSQMPPPPSYGYDATGPAAGPRPGELLDRFVARFIDGVIIGIAYGIVAAIINAILNYGLVAGMINAVIGAVIYLGYFGFMESTNGRTIGKQVMKLRVLGPNGGNPTMEQAVRRNIWMGFGILGIVPILGTIIGGIASLVAVIMIAVGISNDTVNRQAWHDKFAGGTRVVKEG